MKISLNGKMENTDDGITIRDLVEKLGYRDNRVAVAVNGEFVSRTRHEKYQLKENDQIDIVAPMQGG